METINLFDLYAKLTLDDSEYKKKIGEASETTSGFASKIGNGLKNAAAVGAKAMAAASAVAASGVVALAKSAIESYADYEQLVGGVETLFKDSSDEVVKYAANAYKTAGLSANEYMETVTSFSASLLQSLGGDTAEAAKYADRAITSMADNANKMGTDISAIQNAYQGFAKQNYTMLDNLKLGYGGTKEEMQRLIDDASKMTDIQERLGITVDESSMSFDNIVNAIEVMQSSLGVAGATAAEASTTISGSIASMKSAWSNLITGIADDTQDFDTLIDNFVSSVSTVGSNILPRVSVALGGIVNLVTGLAPQIIAAIPPLIEQVLPQLITGIDSIVSAIVGVLPGLVTTIATIIGEQSHLLIQSGLDLLLMLGQSLIDNTPTLVGTVIEVINALAMWLVEYADVLLETGITIITTLATALTENLPVLIPVIMNAILLMVQTLTSPEHLSNLIDAAIAVIGALAEGLLKALPVLLEQAPVIIANLVTSIIQNVPKLLEAAASIITQLVTGIVNLLPKIGEAAGKIVTTVVNGVKNLTSKIKEVGSNIVQGVWNGISEKVSWFTSKVKGFFTGIVNGVKSALGIHSPSKVFASIGGFMAEGLGEGWDNEYSNIKKQIEGGLEFGTAKVGFESSAMGKGNAGLFEKMQSAFSVIGEGVTIVVQSVLDGEVIGETSYQYYKDMLRASGG